MVAKRAAALKVAGHAVESQALEGEATGVFKGWVIQKAGCPRFAAVLAHEKRE